MTNLHKCPDCLNTFHQPFRCTTCGAQRLYDETVRTQAKTIAALRERVAELEGKVTAIVGWLEREQPDVFRRGLWDALREVQSAGTGL